MRITFKALKEEAKELNKAAGTPEQYGKAGHYYIGASYGMYQLNQICESGGNTNITGFGGARETFDKLRSIQYGLSVANA